MSLYLFRREATEEVPPTWSGLEQTYQRIETLFDHLQALYRPMTLTMVRSSLDLLIRDRASKWRASWQTRGRTLQVEPPSQETSGDFDPIQLGNGLDALASWRAESAESGMHTRVGWGTCEGSLVIRWEEQGRIAPSPSTPEGPDSDPSARSHSLVLPLLARILEAHGGRSELSDEPVLRLMLRWPQFHLSS